MQQTQDNNKKSAKSVLEIIGIVIAIPVGVITILTGIITILQFFGLTNHLALIRSLPSSYLSIFQISFISILALLCLYIIFKKKSNNGLLANQNPTSRFAKGWRVSAGLLFIICGYTILSITLSPATSDKENKFVILITSFDGPEKQYRVRDILVDKLREGISSYQDIEIQLVDTVITNTLGSKVARKIGEEYNANIVLWGWYSLLEENSTVSINVELLSTPFNQFGDHMNHKLKEPASSIESFALQEKVTADMEHVLFTIIGLVKYEQKQFDTAIDLFNLAISSNYSKEIFNPFAVYFHLAYAYHFVGKADLALEHFNNSIIYNPSFALSYMGRGLVYMRYGKLEEALQDYIKAIDIDPESNIALVALCNCGMLFGQLQEFDKATYILSIAIQLDSMNTCAYNNRAIAYSQKGQLDSALVDASYAIALDPNFVLAYVSRGDVYMYMNKPDSAMQDYYQAIQLDSTELGFYRRYNRACLAVGDYQQAYAGAYRLWWLAPDHYQSHIFLGKANAGLKNHKEALANFDRAMALHPEDPESYILQASCHADLNNFDQCLYSYSRALEQIHKNLGKTITDTIIIEEPLKVIGTHIDRPYEQFTSVLSPDPDFNDRDYNEYFLYQVYTNRASIFNRKGDKESAIADYSKAIQLNKKDAELYYERGILLSEIGQTKKSQKDFALALKYATEASLDDPFIQKIKKRINRHI